MFECTRVHSRIYAREILERYSHFPSNARIPASLRVYRAEYARSRASIASDAARPATVFAETSPSPDARFLASEQWRGLIVKASKRAKERACLMSLLRPMNFHADTRTPRDPAREIRSVEIRADGWYALQVARRVRGMPGFGLRKPGNGSRLDPRVFCSNIGEG